MAAVSEAQSLAGCPEKCGDVDIPYPFGVGQQPGTSRNCFLDYQSSFNLTCNNSTSKLYFFNVPVSNISLQQSQMEISINVSKSCYNQSQPSVPYQLNAGAFTISSNQNKFVTIGCDAVGLFATMDNSKSNFTPYSGCVAICDKRPPREIIMTDDKTCSGTGCCEVDFRAAIYYIEIVAGSLFNHTDVSSFNNCTYALVVKRDWFSFSLDYLSNFPYDLVPIVLEWTVSNDSCRNASGKEDYACKFNSECVDSSNGVGYNCKCKSGFEGNPYHPDGCHDIDECAIPNICPMPRRCYNHPGYHNCSCPPGFNDINGTACITPQRSNQHNLLILIALGVSVALLVVITLVFTLCWAHKQRTLKQLRQKNFEQNGGDLLLQQLSQQQGYSTTHTKIFTEVELKNATNNFDESRILGQGGQGIVYKGILRDNTVVAIKKSRVGGDPKQIKDFINEVFVLSQINHRNVVKLLGCCLETDVPLLVYEFVNNGTLLYHIDPLKNEISIPWEIRLKIAAETANAISYLHSYASIPIIHRDIKSTNILLDHNLIAKVSDFGASRLVPINESHVTTVVQGTLGYLDPEYLHAGQLNEKSDVYSFGVVLIELLTESKAVEFSRVEEKYLAMYFVSSMKEDRLWEIIDKRVLNEKNEHQLKEVALLARRCVRVKGEERPTMKEVAMELEGMISLENYRSVKGEEIVSEESEYLLGHVPQANGASTSASYGSILREIAFEIADGR
ncbi:hypothetical protein QN277_010232 [Acacia crassicarpa]|uniref:Uncharacterized protein n=1 Tax=Acacia crassicarpa TaxID=499986 RepID=A0AAE1INE6_9FABA|nr:hypothetical protein QN277_010232 [Acacia crassicarpa]